MKKIIAITLATVMLCAAAVSAGAVDRNAMYPYEFRTYGDYEPIIPGKVTIDPSSEVTARYEAPSIFDVTMIQRHIAKIDILDDSLMPNADFDGDGEVSIFDATNIQRCIAGMDYDCVIHGDDSYLITQKSDWIMPDSFVKMMLNNGSGYRFEPYILEDGIAFEHLYAGRYLGEMSRQRDEYYHDRVAPRGIALVTSREQLFALMGYMITEFDDSFFEDRALVVWYGTNEHTQYYCDIGWIGLKDGIMKVVGYQSEWYDDEDASYVSGGTRCSLCSVNKQDIRGVTEIQLGITTYYWRDDVDYYYVYP